MKLPIKIIVFTNFSYYKKECLKMGCDYFFDKSKDFEEMINTVDVISKKMLSANNKKWFIQLNL